MEKLCHQAVLTVFCKEDEDREKIREKLLELVPFDIVAEKINLEEDTALGFNEKKIKIYRIVLDKNRHTKSFVRSLFSRFDEKQIVLLRRQMDSRLDDGRHFFIRLDKERWLKDEIFITDSGSCFHIKISIAAFPSTRQNAKLVLERLLNCENF